MHRKPGSSVLTPPPMRVRRASSQTTPDFAKPQIPPPPALPRFVLPSDTGELDLDSAKTSERRPLTMPAARRIVRKVRTPQPAPVLAPDQTDEVALQDILLEAYLEDPPPPSVDAAIPVEIAYEPPRPSQGRAVDALLRTSDPGIPALARGDHALSPLSSSFPATAYEIPPRSSSYVPAMPVPADYESPSVAPVAYGSYPSYSSAFAPSQPPPAHVLPPPKRTNVLGVFALVLGIFAVSAGTGALLAMPNGTTAKWAAKAKEAVGRKSAPASAPASTTASAPESAPASAPASASASASAPASASTSAFASPSALPSASPPTVTVDNLVPKGGVHPKTTLVVFPPSARGHRIWVDGTMVTAGEKPTMLKCGHRKIQIGSAGKMRKVDLPCGKQIVLDE